MSATMQALTRILCAFRLEQGIGWEDKRLIWAKIKENPSFLGDLVELNRRISNKVWAQVDRDLDRSSRLNIRFINYFEQNYPAKLKDLTDSPPVISLWGSPIPPEIPLLAIVGSRSATRYGLTLAGEIARAVTEAGGGVVSGLARGIDSAAHKGAMSASAGYPGVAVLGSGLLRLYPPENDSLALELRSRSGAVISEYPLDRPALKYQFPERNRLVAALGVGAVVVEAAEKSGAKITARLAGDLGREVFAVPGPITSPLSCGTNRLISEGANPVLSLDEFLEQLQVLCNGRLNTHKGASAKNAQPVLDALEELIVAALREVGSLHVDRLIELSASPPCEVVGAIQRLELAGQIYCLPGSILTLDLHE